MVCMAAIALHYKNWVSYKDNSVVIHTGIYKQPIVYSNILNVQMVDTLPKMTRKNGFSFKMKEKGKFIDSLTPKPIMVFVDNLRQPKILIQYTDSTLLYLNLADSMATQQLFNTLKIKTPLKQD